MKGVQLPNQKIVEFPGLREKVFFSTVVLSLVIAISFRFLTDSQSLYIIRLQQVFGFLAIFYWYMALIVSPISVVIKSNLMPKIKHARRSLGLSVAYFALLHTYIVIWLQFDGPSSILKLPNSFQWSILWGSFGLLVLFLMALTSNDLSIKFMGINNWLKLHKVSYIAGIATIIHVWMIGTHTIYSGISYIAGIMLIILFGLEAIRVSKNLVKNNPDLKDMAPFLATLIFVILSAALYFMPNVVTNYHTKHDSRGAINGH